MFAKFNICSWNEEIFDKSRNDHEFKKCLINQKRSQIQKMFTNWKTNANSKIINEFEKNISEFKTCVFTNSGQIWKARTFLKNKNIFKKSTHCLKFWTTFETPNIVGKPEHFS